MGTVHKLSGFAFEHRTLFAERAKRVEMLRGCVEQAANDVAETGHGIETLRLMLTRLRAARLELEVITGRDETPEDARGLVLAEIRAERRERVRDMRLFRLLLALTPSTLARLPAEVRRWCEDLARSHRRLEQAQQDARRAKWTR